MSKQVHYAVCVERNGARDSWVETHPAHTQTYLLFPRDPKRVGYVGYDRFLDAIDCASRMALGERWL